MAQAKHTPWEIGPHPWPEQIGCCPLVGRPWSVHGTNHHNVAAAVSEDIARLIAAAPDMLEALKRLERWFDTDEELLLSMTGPERVDHERQVAMIRAAIAKATGEASHGE